MLLYKRQEEIFVKDTSQNYKKFYFNHDRNVEYKKEYVLTPHYHNMYEMYFITDGNCTYFIDNKTYQVMAGDIVLIPSGVIHNTKYSNSVHSRMLINFPKQFIPSSVLPMLSALQYIYRNPSVFDEILNIMKKIEYEYYHPDTMTDELLYCYTQNLFFILAKNKEKCTKITAGNSNIEQAIEYIQKNFSTDISLVSIATMCSVSSEHFSRMFKKETGFGFNKYLNLLRLQKAYAMLKQSSDITVSQVASECGFSDSNYFSTKFKELYGLPPKKLQTGN